MRKSIMLALIISTSSIAWGMHAAAYPVLQGMALVESAQGNVQIQISDGTKSVPVPGASLAGGTTLVTGPDSRVRLLLNPDSPLVIMPDSTVRLLKMEKHPAEKREAYEIRIDSGIVFCRAELMQGDSTLEFSTPHSQVLVTGTVLAVAVSQSGTTAQVLDGAVAITGSAGQTASLTDQTQTTVLADGAVSAVTALTPDQTAAFSILTALDPAVAPVDSALQGTGLVVTAPVNGFITSAASILVTGSALPNTTVNVNGSIILTTGNNRSFSVSVSLVEGSNTITVTATRKDKTDTIVLTVIRDSTPPILILTQPSGGTFGAPGDGCTYTGSAIQCTIIGLTEPGALLTIDNVSYPVQPDGSFSTVVTVPVAQQTIVAAAQDALGNRTTTALVRVIDSQAVAYITVTVSPSSITADGQSTALLTIQSRNFFFDPVSAAVSLSSTSGGSLSASSTFLAGGTGAATFTAGVVSQVSSVTITASSNGITGTATLTLLPDAPPSH